MNQAGASGMMRNYRKTGLSGAVEGASPHRLIQMLMEGVLDRIASGRGLMTRGAIAEKGEQISWAISIIDGLRASLDKTDGGEIAQNLDNLYGYMILRLTEANMKNDPARLDEVSDLLRQIKGAWDAIPLETISQHSAANGRAQVAVADRNAESPRDNPI